MSKTIKISKETLFIIIGGLVLTIILLAPSKILLTCPKGLKYDTLGGQCGLYTDANQDQVCDYAQGLVTVNEEIETAEKFNFDLSFAPQAGLFIVLLVLSILFLIQKQREFVKCIIQTVSFITLGILAFKNICPISTLQFLLLLKDRIVLTIFPFLIFLLPIITTLIFGQVFCGWICPIGTFQEFTFKLIRIPFKKFPNISDKIPLLFNYFRYLVLIITLILVVYTSQTVFCKFDPFGNLFGYQSTLITKIFLGIVFISLPLLFRPFCKYICPYGALLGILSGLSIFKIKINEGKCKDCQLCKKICPIGAIDCAKVINEQICNRCGNCLRVCKNKAIRLQK